MNDLQAKSTNTLALCPFCGGEVEMLTAESMNGGYLFGIMCNDCRSRGDVYGTEAEAIAAWNSRAERTCKMEYSGGVHEFLSLDTWTCSECGCEMYDAAEPHFCPNCGARRVGE